MKEILGGRERELCELMGKERVCVKMLVGEKWWRGEEGCGGEKDKRGQGNWRRALKCAILFHPPVPKTKAHTQHAREGTPAFNTCREARSHAQSLHIGEDAHNPHSHIGSSKLEM